MIEIRNLSFEYEAGHPVLIDINLKIAAGTVHCILGPNGSGKTTLLHSILGYLQPESGEVLISGRNVGEMSSARRSRLISYVPQIQDYAYNYRVLDAVLMGRAAGRPGWFIPGAADERAARGILGELGLAELENRPVNALSGGELQLVSLARSLCRNPRFIILDEPESHLDPSRDLRLHRILSDLAAAGKAVILTSHNPLNISDYAGRISCLNQGRLAASGSPADVLRADVLEKLYGIPYREFRDGGKLYPVPDYSGIINGNGHE